MQKSNSTVIKETKYIIFVVGVLSIIMQIVFAIGSWWSYKILLSNIYTDIITVLNFYIMGIYVSKAVTKDEKEAQKIIKLSHTLRSLGLFVCVVLGVLLPCFNLYGIVIPLFFPRIAFFIRPLFKNYNIKNEEGKNESDEITV